MESFSRNNSGISKSSNPSNRQKQFNSAIKKSKERRHNIMMKRRSIIHGTEDISMTESQISQLLSQLQSCTGSEKLTLLKQLKVLLSQENNPPLQYVLQNNIVNIFLSILDSGQDQLILECLWCLINLSCIESDQIQPIMVFVPYLFNFLRNNKNIFKEQSLWILGNIAAENDDQYRTQLIQMGIVPLLLSLLRSCLDDWNRSTDSTPTKDSSFLSLGFWTLYNLLRGRVEMNCFINEGLLSLCEKYLSYQNKEVQSDILWILATLTTRNDDICNYIMTSSIHVYFYTNIHKMSEEELIPLLKVIGNIFAGDNDFIYKLISNENICLSLYTCLLNSTSVLCKDTLWIVSNIFLSDERSIEILLKNRYIPVLYQLLLKGTWEQRQETLICFVNLCLSRSFQYSQYLFHSFLIRGCLDIFTSANYLSMNYAVKLLLYVSQHGPSSLMKEFEDHLDYIDQLSYNSSIPMTLSTSLTELSRSIHARLEEMEDSNLSTSVSSPYQDIDMEIPKLFDTFTPPSFSPPRSNGTLFHYFSKE